MIPLKSVMIPHLRHPSLSLITIICVNYDNLINKNTVIKILTSILKQNKNNNWAVITNYTELNLKRYASLKTLISNWSNVKCLYILSFSLYSCLCSDSVKDHFSSFKIQINNKKSIYFFQCKPYTFILLIDLSIISHLLYS